MELTLSMPFVAAPAVTRHPGRDAVREWRAAEAERQRRASVRPQESVPVTQRSPV